VSEIRDPGLQAERTSLAWGRTALAASIAALLVTRDGFVSHQPALSVAGLLLLAAAAVTGVAARRRQSTIVAAVAEGRSPMSRHGMLTLTAMVIVLGLAVVWSVLV